MEKYSIILNLLNDEFYLNNNYKYIKILNKYLNMEEKKLYEIKKIKDKKVDEKWIKEIEQIIK